MGWKDTIKPESKEASSGSSWRDSITPEKKEPGMLQTILDQGTQGALGGFGDEINGLVGAGERAVDIDNDKGGMTVDWETLKQAYKQARDQSRNSLKAEQAAHPTASTIANVGGMVANPLTRLSGIGGMAVQGAAQGLGDSEADTLGGMAKDAVLGGALGAGAGAATKYVVSPVLQKAGQLADSAVQYGASKSPLLNKAVSKISSLAAGVDKDAALRQIERPMESAQADADDFAFKTGQRASNEIQAKAQELGQNVGKAKSALLNDSGDLVFENAKALPQQIDEFLQANKPSKQGFSALSGNERGNLTEMAEMLRNGETTGEDLVKFREHLDQAQKLAGKYDVEGTGPYTNFLKSLRHNADGMLDNFDSRFDNANKAFTQFKDDTGILRGASNDARAESTINNLYGANKGMQQEAAGRLLKPETLDAAKDLAANKAFENAKRPGGDNYFRRAALAVLTSGASEVATNPNLWKGGLRYMGKVEQAIKSNPQALGKFSGVLANAAQRGPQALAAAHFVLSQQNQEYRQTMDKLQDDKGNGQ